MKTGDKIAAVAQPIAKGIDAILGTQIRRCGGCKQMQGNLNAGMSVAGAIRARYLFYKQEAERQRAVHAATISTNNTNATTTKIVTE